jgi:hypothetical protein
MFVGDFSYRGRVASIDGPLEVVVECVGGDDLYSPERCFGKPVQVKFATKVYYPLCGSHREARLGRTVRGSLSVSEFDDAVSILAQSMGTRIVAPVHL